MLETLATVALPLVVIPAGTLLSLGIGTGARGRAAERRRTRRDRSTPAL
jgi:hypothetical protein